MSHEVSETVRDPQTGRWVNVYGKGTAHAGKRLPADASGVGHEEYDSAEEAAAAARKRSEAYEGAEKDFKRGFERINRKRVPNPRPDRKVPPATLGGTRS